MPSPPDEFPYDVFISYRQREPDQSWVRTKLLPALKHEGFRVFIDFECFRLGAPVITEMERGVLQSRYTLSVLSPEYLKSNFATVENLMADHLGLEQSRRRLLSVMRTKCDADLRMRLRLWLDMTDDAEFESHVTYLAGQLRLPPDE
jgi:hypothetical protein